MFIFILLASRSRQNLEKKIPTRSDIVVYPIHGDGCIGNRVTLKITDKSFNSSVYL